LTRVGAWLRSPRLTTPQWVAALAVVLVVALSRAPYLLLHGRFWAEEGTVHFAHSATSSFVDAIGFVYTNARYYNLFPNVATWIATEVPLERAPLVTAWMSFGVVALMVWIALAWPSDLLPNVGAKLAAVVLLVVGTLAEPEVWLNTLHVQVYLAIVALLLLFVRVHEIGRPRFVAGLAVLVVAGLTGLYAAAFAPLFVVRALLERTRRRFAWALAIVVPALVQVVVVLTREDTQHVESVKATNPGIEEAVRTILVWHVSGFAFGQDLVEDLRYARAGTVLGWVALVLGGLVVVGVVALVCRLLPSAWVALLLVGAFVLIEALIQLGAFGEAGGRYVVLPIAILTLLTVYVAATARPGWLQYGAVALCGLVLLVGLSQFWTRQSARLRCIDCPEWDRPVERWQEDHDRPLVIWPYAGEVRGQWRIRLP
jgi:hypothetical protein